MTTYCAAISAYEKSREWVLTLHLFSILQRTSLEVEVKSQRWVQSNVITYNTVISALRECLQHNKLEANVIAYNIAIGTCNNFYCGSRPFIVSVACSRVELCATRLTTMLYQSMSEGLAMDAADLSCNT